MASAAGAATFVVPSDADLTRKAVTIVSGTAGASHVEITPSGGLRTITEIAVHDVLKGGLAAGVSIRVASPGGVAGDRAFVVPGAPRFTPGDEVLLFLSPDNFGDWTPTDLTLGRFSFRRAGTETVLIRDAHEIVGWNPDGSVHRERPRSAAPFLAYVRAIAAGRPVLRQEYFSESPQAMEVTIGTDSLEPAVTASPFPAGTYLAQATSLNGIARKPRWPSFGSGILFYNYNTLPAAPGGGVDAIRAGTAMWTDECGSSILYGYGGTTGRQQCLFSSADGVNGVSFGDPCNEVSGSVGPGGGVLGLGGYWVTSTANTLGGETFWNITEGNIALNNGLETWMHVGNPTYMNQVMAHELGHTLGFRHSDQSSEGGACNPSAMECTSAAIMVSSIGAAYTNLQPYDVNAAQTVYPGGTCGAPPPPPPPPPEPTPVPQPAPTGRVTRGDFGGDGRADIMWRNTASGANSYWTMNAGTLFSSGLLPQVDPTFTVAGFGDFQGDGKTDVLWRNTSSGANVVWLMNGNIVAASGQLPVLANLNWTIAGVGDFQGDGKDDVLWRNNSTGDNAVWFMNGTSVAASSSLPYVGDTRWRIAAVGDFTGDGRDDVVWRNSVTGGNSMWVMNGASIAQSASLPPVPDASWTIVGAGDFQADGRADLFWRNTASGATSVWLMSGAAIVSSGALPTVSDTSWRPVRIADFNADGRADVFWRNANTGGNVIWFVDGITVSSSAPVQAVPDTRWTVAGPP